MLQQEDALKIRETLLAHLRTAPAQMTATALVQKARENGGGAYTEGQLKLELARMLGQDVKMNPNRTLSAGR